MNHLTTKLFGLALLTTAAVACDGTTRVDAPTGPDAESLCLAHDPAVRVDFDADASAWQIDGDPLHGGYRSFDATCVVDGTIDAPTGLQIAFTCDDGTDADLPFALEVDLPDDLELAVDTGLEVQVRYNWNAPGHHLAEGEHVTIHDATGETLLLSVMDTPFLSEADEATLAVAIEADETLCGSPCGEDAFECDEPLRLGVRLDDGGAEPKSVLDGRRDQWVSAAGVRYEVMVDQAEAWSCLNCGNRYVAIIAAQPPAAAQ